MPRQAAHWTAPLGAAAIALQVLVLAYFILVGGVLELLGSLCRVILPMRRISELVNRAAHAAAPRVLTDPRDWPILPVTRGDHPARPSLGGVPDLATCSAVVAARQHPSGGAPRCWWPAVREAFCNQV